VIIHLQRHQHYFVQIDRRALEDPRLSWKATGLLSYLLSKPPDWKIRLEHLTSVKRGGRHQVLCGLQELARYGYATMVNEHGADGRFITRGYVVREEPEGGYIQLPEGAPPVSILPQSDFPPEENPSGGKPASSKKDLCSKKDPDTRAREDHTGCLSLAAAQSERATQPAPPTSEGKEADATGEPEETATTSTDDVATAAPDQPGAIEPNTPTEPSPPSTPLLEPSERPRGYEHLTPPPNDLYTQWLARFPDETVRDAWWHVGKRRLRCKKGAAVIGDCAPSIIAEALEAYEAYVALLARQGQQVNGTPLYPPRRE
jgi:hypothetical protein